MALNLKLKRKCHIVAPEWLNVGWYLFRNHFSLARVISDFLQERLTQETSSGNFSDLPFRYAEISKVLLDLLVFRFFKIRHELCSFLSRASDDLLNPDKLRSLLKDIREARQAKTRDLLLKLNPNAMDVRRFFHARGYQF